MTDPELVMVISPASGADAFGEITVGADAAAGEAMLPLAEYASMPILSDPVVVTAPLAMLTLPSARASMPSA